MPSLSQIEQAQTQARFSYLIEFPFCVLSWLSKVERTCCVEHAEARAHAVDVRLLGASRLGFAVLFGRLERNVVVTRRPLRRWTAVGVEVHARLATSGEQRAQPTNKNSRAHRRAQRAQSAAPYLMVDDNLDLRLTRRHFDNWLSQAPLAVRLAAARR